MRARCTCSNKRASSLQERAPSDTGRVLGTPPTSPSGPRAIELRSCQILSHPLRVLTNTPGQSRRVERLASSPLQKFLGNRKESRYGCAVGHNSKAPTPRGSSDLADSALHHRTVPTKRPSATLKSLVSQPDLDFRRRLELKTDLIGQSAQLPCPVLFLLPRSSWDAIGRAIH